VKAGARRRGRGPWRAESPRELRAADRSNPPGREWRTLVRSKTLKSRALPGAGPFRSRAAARFGATRRAGTAAWRAGFGPSRLVADRRWDRAFRRSVLSVVVGGTARFGVRRSRRPLSEQAGRFGGRGASALLESEGRFGGWRPGAVGFGGRFGGRRARRGSVQRARPTARGERRRRRRTAAREEQSSEGHNPLSGSGMKQGRQARGG
jgi:hypothetical protein